MLTSIVLASTLFATPLGPGPIPGFDRNCDRIRIYDANTNTNWLLCINGVYEYPDKKQPIDRSLPKHKSFIL